MRLLILMPMLLLAPTAPAALAAPAVPTAPQVAVRIVTSQGSGFQLSASRVLTRLGPGGSKKTRKLGGEEARLIEKKVLRLIWGAEGSRVKGQCALYANLKAAGEKARICGQDRKSTGILFGLLRELDSRF